MSTNTNQSRRRPSIVEIEPDVPGYRLLVLLFRTAAERNMLAKDVAESLGVTPGYLTHLRNGTQPMRNVSRDVLERICSFVGVPVVAGMMLADQLAAKDYYLSDAQQLEEEANNAIAYIQRDVDWGGFLPVEVAEGGSLALRLFVILAYERATGRRLVNGKLNLPKLVEELKRLEETEKNGAD